MSAPNLTVLPKTEDPNRGEPPRMGMDRRIQKPAWKKRKNLIGAAVIALLIGAGAWVALNSGGGQTVRVAEERLTISTVGQGSFEDFIPVRGAIEPLNSIFLDASEGGRVEKRFVEPGTPVKAGQPLVELSNTQLQISVLNNEVQVVEQLNQMRSLEIALEATRLSNKQSLADAEYQIVTLEREIQRRAALVKNSAVSQRDFLQTQDELQYQRSRRDIILESRATTERMREEQLQALSTTVKGLERQLELARRSLDNLVVRAPVDGVLTTLDAEVGQNKTRGEQIGRIDRTDGFKVVAQVDEFYLPRLAVGQSATAEIALKPQTLTVTKIYPQVQNGQFRVDLEFAGPAPDGVRPGQTLQLRLRLGDTATALLIPNGAFYQDTGGSWIFVLDPSGSFATKRDIKVGRRNSQFIEVWEGLAPGERVVTSAYGDMVRMDRIKLD